MKNYIEHTPSFRAQLLTRRTYNRPLDEAGTVFETWEQTVDRVIEHQRWLWERVVERKLNKEENEELSVLRILMLQRKVSVSGRTLWLGGTDIAKTREASQFNCSFTYIEDVYDVVDGFWLLLQGCGVGFKPVSGTLSGFAKPVQVIVHRSSNKTTKGFERNQEWFYGDEGSRVWHLRLGDSAEAWAKAAGKLLTMKKPVDRIFLDFSEIRAPGIRLKGYGWISSGDETISKAFAAICEILSAKAGQLLDKVDILDVMNWLGTTLSSRRSAEISVMDSHDVEAERFALAKKNYWETGNPQRSQSNNSLLFWSRPSKLELKGVFQMMLDAGGSEPGFVNAVAALKRAPWFKGVNPCAEILLGNKSFCNLVEVDMGKFLDDFEGLRWALYYASRANYRQTCVNLKDGVLSDSWHELNEFLRLCGVGLTGIVKWLDHHAGQFFDIDVTNGLMVLREEARRGAFSMADELGLPRPKAVTTVKPSGTLGKIMDTTEGVHKPLGKYIFNNVKFSRHDPLVELLRKANYHLFDAPNGEDAIIARLPVSYDDVEFDTVDLKRRVTSIDGKYVSMKTITVEVNQETAVDQLERYKLLMDCYVDHNCSITVSYSPDEIPSIVDWLYENWDCYVGVSFILRNDPTKTAQDLGYPYLPQEVVTKEAFDDYVSRLLPVDIDAGNSHDMIAGDDCATGACPIR